MSTTFGNVILLVSGRRKTQVLLAIDRAEKPPTPRALLALRAMPAVNWALPPGAESSVPPPIVVSVTAPTVATGPVVPAVSPRSGRSRLASAPVNVIVYAVL